MHNWQEKLVFYNSNCLYTNRELHLFALPENQNHVDIQTLFQVKTRFEVAKSFYYLLGKGGGKSDTH